MRFAERKVGCVGMVHTVSTLSLMFDNLLREYMPDVGVLDVVDESLLRDVVAAGGIEDEVERRLSWHVDGLLEEGADVVIVTCSSLGPAVEKLGSTGERPLLRVDTAMADEAVRTGRRVGVLATLETTLRPTVELVRERAEKAGRRVEVVEHLCRGAFAALRAGDPERHDALISEGRATLESQVDVVVLAQASMALAVGGGRDGGRVPVLSSPKLAVESLSRLGRRS